MPERRIGTASTGIAAAFAAAFAAMVVLSLALPAEAVESEAEAPPSKTEERPADQLVPIPGWSKDVADNGCPLRAAPVPFTPDTLTSLTEIPFWVLIEKHVGRYSVRASLDAPDKFAKSLGQLDPDLRTLTILHVLWDGLGRDGLHTYFYLRSGQTAPLVRDALKAAGFSREHTLFSNAMALFGAVYPVDEGQREKLFGFDTPSKELNGFDRRLLAIGGEFGSREAWTGAIVAYVNRTPALWKRIEAGRKTLGDMARLEHLTSALGSRIDLWMPYTDVQSSLAAFTEQQRTLFVLAAFNTEFENGGVHQFFYNAEGSLAPEVHAALAGIGLDRQAELMAQGIAMFGNPYPRDTEQRRESHFHNHQGWNDWDKQLSGLTDAFYALDGGPQVLNIGGDRQIQGGPGLRYAMLAFALHHNMLPC